MCGLVGIYSPTISDANLQLFKGLLLVDQIRGMHATGVIKVQTKDNTVTMHKRAEDAVDFLARPDTKEFLDKDRGQIYIGHNRYATVGDKAAHANAHPFQEGHITLVHNGGVDSHAFDKLSGQDRKDVVVDSHAVAITIAEHGVKKAVTEHLSGGFALIWWDSKERSLNFIRNPDRPLYMGVLTDGSLVWASEKGMLDVYCKRPGNRAPSFRMDPVLIEHSNHVKFLFNEQGYRIGQAPVTEPMAFLEVPFPKSQGLWWENGSYTSTPRSQASSQSGNADASKQKLTESDVRNAERVNSLLVHRRLPLRYGSVLSVDVKEVKSYDTTRTTCHVIGVDRASGQQIDIWSIDSQKVQGVSVIRCVLDNAYLNKSALVITARRASVSVFDLVNYPKNPSPYYLDSYLSQGQVNEMQEAREAHRRKMSPAVNIAKSNVSSLVSFPFKVQGHTFMSRDELTDFLIIGCDTCGNVPTPYNRHNSAMIVRAGKSFTGLLEECVFTCGECSEM